MRVLFFVTRDWYHPATTGGDNTLWEYARYLAAVGNDVTYVTSSYAGAARSETLEGISVVRLGSIYWLWLTTFFHYWRNCRGKFDVVVTEGFGGSRIPRLAPLYVREPIVTAWHQVHASLFAAQYPRLARGPLNFLERFTAWVHRQTLVQAYTDEWKDEFLRLGFRSENVFVLPVCIREDWLDRTDGHQINGSTILWIGKLRRYKCPDHVVRAMGEVIKRVPSAKLVLAIRSDDHKYETELRDLVKRLRLESSVEFRINVTDEAKRDLLNSARALVVPSAVEGFGIVVLEANARGVPVVASSGVPLGAVCDNFNGLRYAYGDIGQLGKTLVAILSDDDLYRRLSINAQAFARRFAWQDVSSRYAEILERAAQGAHP